MNIKEVENYFNTEKKKHLTKDFRKWWEEKLIPAVELFGLIDIINKQGILIFIQNAIDQKTKDKDRQIWVDRAIKKMQDIDKLFANLKKEGK